MYTHARLKAWEFNVLHNCPWFVECPPSFSPFEENREYNVVDGIHGVQEEDTWEVSPPTS